MSRELFYQSLILKVVRQMGGQGFKLTNKFKSGVPDLLIKLPGELALIAEVKYEAVKKSISTTTIDVTVLQERFLRTWSDVDMDVAVIKVIEYGNVVYIGMTEPGYFSGWDDQDYGQPFFVPVSSCPKPKREQLIRLLLERR